MVKNEWVCPEYVQSRWADLSAALVQHTVMTVLAVVIGLVLAVPLAALAYRVRWLRPATVGAATLIYTVPSLAMFSLLLPVFGLSMATTVTGLSLYSLTILVRNILAGLDDVDPGIKEAAQGMGYSRLQRLLFVEVPVALPATFAGIRVAAVSTVALATIGVLVGYGGLGNIIVRGMNSNFRPEVLTASALCVVLAVCADVVLLGLQRTVTPWNRKQTS